MDILIRTRLSIMMFLEYAIWGAWYVTMGTYIGTTLEFGDLNTGIAYGTTAIAAMISPFFVGLIADRFFATERVLGFLHLIGAGLMYWVSTIQDFGTFYPVLLGYAVCYMPTIALTNAIAFHQMKNPQKEFPTIRVLGTLGWIVLGIIVGKVKLDGNSMEPTNIPMMIAAFLSLIMGIYSFTLPRTIPMNLGRKLSVKEILGLDALELLKQRSFLVLFLASLLISIPLSFYYNFANKFLNEVGMDEPAFAMTFGQVSEVVFMLVMPFFFKRLGVKWMMVIGMAAWALRYILFAMGDPVELIWMFYAGIILHGICYDFFFVTGQIYADNKSPDHLRSSVQGLMTFATYGVGMFIGSWVSGYIVELYTLSEPIGTNNHAWAPIWLIPAIFSLMVMLGFALVFYEEEE